MLCRYLVEKILSSLTPVKTPSTSGSRRAKRDVDTAAAAAAAAVSSAVTAVRSGGPTLRRTRRSLDAAPPPLQDSEPVSLIRVKRLGDEDDDQEMEMGHRVMTPQQPVGLQRMKRIDDEPQPQPAKHSRRRRSLTYDPNLLAQHILQYLPQ